MGFDLASGADMLKFHDLDLSKCAPISDAFRHIRIRRAEPVRSILRHRVVMGVDEWDESDGGEKYEVDEILDDMMGPYKEVFDRL